MYSTVSGSDLSDCLGPSLVHAFATEISKNQRRWIISEHAV